MRHNTLALIAASLFLILAIPCVAETPAPADEIRKAAEQGNAAAQFDLGLIYNGGDGVTRDYAEAAKWFRMAAEQGHASAQFYVGLMYRDGQGVARNYAHAYMWLSLATAQNYAKARQALDDLEKKVTPQQRDEAQRMAREWKPIHN